MLTRYSVSNTKAKTASISCPAEPDSRDQRRPQGGKRTKISGATTNRIEALARTKASRNFRSHTISADRDRDYLVRQCN